MNNYANSRSTYFPNEAFSIQNAFASITKKKCFPISPSAVKSAFPHKFPLAQNSKNQYNKNKESAILFGSTILPENLKLHKADLYDAAIIALFEEMPDSYFKKTKSDLSRKDIKNMTDKSEFSGEFGTGKVWAGKVGISTDKMNSNNLITKKLSSSNTINMNSKKITSIHPDFKNFHNNSFINGKYFLLF